MKTKREIGMEVQGGDTALGWGFFVCDQPKMGDQWYGVATRRVGGGAVIITEVFGVRRAWVRLKIASLTIFRTGVESWILASLQRRCQHPKPLIQEDILEHVSPHVKVRKCGRCGAFTLYEEATPGNYEFCYMTWWRGATLRKNDARHGGINGPEAHVA